MKKIVFVLFLFFACAFSAQALGTSARGACVLLANDNTVLYGKDENTRLAMASTTKIATAIVAIENCELEAELKISSKEEGVEGSSMYLKAGEVFTLDELLYGLMINSGNDAAAAISKLVAGGESEFVVLMNELAMRLGLENTSFQNPSGLDAKGHYTTARELAILTSYALKNDDFRRYVSTKSIEIPSDSTRVARHLRTKNRILLSYEGAIGVKTGYTIASGRSLVTAAKRGEATIVAVTIRDGNDWADHRKMLDYGFNNVRSIRFMDYAPEQIAIPIAGGGEVIASMPEVGGIAIAANRDVGISARIVVPKFLYSGIGFMQQVGEVRFYRDGELFKSAPLISNSSIPCEEEIKPGKNLIWNYINKIFGK